MVSDTSSIEHVLAYSTILEIFKIAPSSSAPSWSGISFSRSISPSRWISTMFVWVSTIRTRAVCPCASIVIWISKTLSDEDNAISIGHCFRNMLIFRAVSGGAQERTSSAESSFPTVIPAAIADSMPFIPLVAGTTTLFTFLTILPLTAAVTFCGSIPRVFLPTAAA